jgi:uncharacterized Tic20 family protein
MNEASPSERIWAAMGHWLGALGFIPVPLVNVAGPLFVFLIERAESQKAAFHAKQSFYLQLAVDVVVWLGIIIAQFLIWLFGILSGIYLSWLSILIVVFWLVIRMAAALYALLGGIKVYQGAEFEYIFFGRFARTH